MVKKYPRSEAIQDVVQQNEEAYVGWTGNLSNKSNIKALQSFSNAVGLVLNN
ncbi:hypothetical protein LCGC14_1206910 [marine sediment metagenome]|uniref:Uncharacterized protein n=1 Tax=marine sediment metagenome TaxID=412755 RepID=A0A0F9PJV3_9ZZZZ